MFNLRATELVLDTKILFILYANYVSTEDYLEKTSIEFQCKVKYMSRPLMLYVVLE